MFWVLAALLRSNGISADVMALRAAAILAMEWMRFLTFDATERALSGSPSFVVHTCRSISLSTSFMRGSYDDPWRLARNGTTENGDIVLLTTTVKE